MSERLAEAPPWLDDRQTAALLQVRRKRVHELRADHSGSFPRARHDSTGSLIWSRDEVTGWAQGQGITLSRKRLPGARPQPTPDHDTPQVVRVVLAVLCGLAVLAVSILMYRQRLSDHVTNVDDYLYARQADTFLRSFTSDGIGVLDAWREFGVNSPLVPTLATPLSAGDSTPSHLVLVQLPLVIGLFVALGALLGRLGLRQARWPLAGLLAVAPPVLTYTAMLSFSIAATLGVVGSLLAYLSSQRLRSRPAALWFGVALGLLSLSRVVALVYLVALALPVLVDLALDRDDLEERGRNALATLGIAFVIAAPWWLSAGPKAMKYLLDAGYSSGSVFTRDRSLLGKVEDRLVRTADETGWLLALAVLAVFVLGTLAVAVRHRRKKSEVTRALLVTSATCVLGMAFLGTSSNAGTAFALPYVVVGAGVGVAGIALVLDGRWLPLRVVLAGAVAAAVGLSTFAVLQPDDPSTWGARQLWISGTPARAQVESALGCSDCPLPNGEALNREVYRQIRTAPTLILRADAIVNVESLRYLGQVAKARVDLRVAAGSTLAPSDLQGVGYAIGGRTVAPYLGVDLGSTEATLRAAGFCPTLRETLSSVNELILWKATEQVSCG